MAPSDTSYTTSYQPAIVSIAVSCFSFKIMKNIMTLSHSPYKATDPRLSTCCWQCGSMFIQFYTEIEIWQQCFQWHRISLFWVYTIFRYCYRCNR